MSFNFESLLFFYSDGCSACALAEPELQRYVAEHPRLFVLRVKADGPLAERYGVKVRATPTYVYRVGAQAVAHEGALTTAKLDKWIKAATGQR